MPLQPLGISNHSTDIDQQTEEQIREVFSILDRKVEELSKVSGLLPAQVKLLRPLHQCTVVGDIEVFVVLSVHELGGISTERFVGWSAKPIDLATAIYLAERDLGFNDAFGFKLPRSILSLEASQQEEEAAQIAQRYIDDEIADMERQRRIVRLNPIFRERDFLVDEQFVFVLSPFEEPFDTIYADHVKPTVELIQGFRCLRADDIYDNRPIMEDIWRCTNEAVILIAELTGRNPNVFYETGVAHTVGKEVILITQSMEDVPFDLKHLRCIVYEYTPRGIAALEQNLRNTVLNVLARRD